MDAVVRVVERLCEAEDVVVVSVGRMLPLRVQASLNLLAAARTAGVRLKDVDVAQVEDWLREAVARVRQVPLAACPFEGDVEVTTEPNGHEWWVCPLCDTEYSMALTKEEMRGE
jgi:hypothetical protein